MSSVDRVLAGKTVVVTGAARGLGEAIARDAAAQGAAVMLGDIDGEVAEASAQSIRESGGVARAMRVDMSDWDSVDAMLDATVAEFGTLDGMVNNAGRFAMVPMADVTPSTWSDLLATNILGVAIGGQLAARRMLAQESGAIVNVTSNAQCGLPLISVYGATKGAVASLTYTWALELGGRGIRVNGIVPTAETRMMDINRDFRERVSDPESLPSQPPARVNAPLVTYLLSDLAKDINGQVVRFNGQDLGLYAHPTVMTPLLRADEWTVTGIAEAFRTELAGRQVPVGLMGLVSDGAVVPEAPGWRL